METKDTQSTNLQLEELSLLDAVVVCARHKRLLAFVPSVLALVTMIVVLVIPKVYTARTTIMPPQQNQSNALAILGQISGIGSIAQSSLGLKNPSDIFANILRSRSVSDAIVTRFDLKTQYGEDLMVDARNELEARVNIILSKDGVIGIEVDDEDPTRAAKMANAYVEELEKITRKLAVGEASQRRLFFEQQVNLAKENLLKAETSLRTFQEVSGLVVPQGQAQLTVSASASLQAQIAAREVQLNAMRSYASKENPELVRLQQEIAELRKQLAQLDRTQAGAPGGVLVPLGAAPKAGLEYLQRLREVRYSEVLFELLAKQYEIAKVDEANNATIIQVIDAALAPEKESRPRKALSVVVAAIVGLILAIAVAVLKETLLRIQRDPVQSEKLETLNQYVRWR